MIDRVEIRTLVKEGDVRVHISRYTLERSYQDRGAVRFSVAERGYLESPITLADYRAQTLSAFEATQHRLPWNIWENPERASKAMASVVNQPAEMTIEAIYRNIDPKEKVRIEDLKPDAHIVSLFNPVGETSEKNPLLSDLHGKVIAQTPVLMVSDELDMLSLTGGNERLVMEPVPYSDQDGISYGGVEILLVGDQRLVLRVPGKREDSHIAQVRHYIDGFLQSGEVPAEARNFLTNAAQ